MFTFAIPDMHVVGHSIKCQDTFSFQFLPGSGQTCGEGIEQGWAAHNALATSTREMTAGSRADTIEDHLGAWNWRKVVHMPRQLKAALEWAISKATDAREDLARIEGIIGIERKQLYLKYYLRFVEERTPPCPWRHQDSGKHALFSHFPL